MIFYLQGLDSEGPCSTSRSRSITQMPDPVLRWHPAVTPAASSKAKILPLNATATVGAGEVGWGPHFRGTASYSFCPSIYSKIQLPILENSERLIFPVIHHPDTQRLVRYLSPKPSVLTCMHPTSSQELYPNPFPRRPQYHLTQCHQMFKGIVFVNDN